MKGMARALFEGKEAPLTNVDELFGESLVTDLSARAFLAKLMSASRIGHLCIREENAPTLPENIPICRLGDLYYLKRHFDLEKRIAKELQRLKASLTLITGGPGTGKTYQAGVLMKELGPCQIALAAPTGKAAAQLSESLKRAMPDLPAISPMTLHTLLKLHSKERQLLDADVVIVDECSMVDVRSMAILLESVKEGAKLILLGDPDQLPPIEAGSLFKEMVKALPGNVVSLKKCFRIESETIIKLANSIRDGKLALEAVQELTTPKALINKILPFFEGSDNFCLLSPMRQGPWGVDALNRLIDEKLNRRIKPILITRNSPRLGLFNGEVGLLDGDQALFPGKKPIPAILLPSYELAYCLSIHKSQGAEFDHVALVMPEGSELFGRELLYTGVTRARRKLDLFGSLATLEATVANQTSRLSGLAEQMEDKG